MARKGESVVEDGEKKRERGGERKSELEGNRKTKSEGMNS